MDISVFGLGYVGAVTSACLASNNHYVTGVDIKKEKVDAINGGNAPFFEKGLNDLIGRALERNKLRATVDVKDAVHNTDLSLVCVGTPSNPDGSMHLDHILRVCHDLGEALADKDSFHVVAVRSTVLPGTTENVIIPTLEKASGKSFSKDFGIAFNPEFLREGEAIYDFFNPERIVIGARDQLSADYVKEMYDNINAASIRTTLKTAEMIKYVDNTFHALKVAFANEVGSICKKLDIDSHEVMNVFCMDRKLNLSPYYLKPGISFGGSCLLKDSNALLSKSKELNLRCPLLESIIESNQAHLNRIVELIANQNKKKIGILGLSFKSNTSDTRESPTISIISRLSEKGYLKLFEKGYDINIYDPNIDRNDMENVPRYISPMLNSSLQETVDNSDVLVIANNSEHFRQVTHLMRDDQVLLDLARTFEPGEVQTGRYIGICW